MGLWKKLNRGKDKLMKSKWYTNPNPIVLLERKVSNNPMGCPKKCYVECAPQTRMSKALKATSSATQLEVLHAAFHVLKSLGIKGLAKSLSIALKNLTDPNAIPDNFKSTISPKQALAVMSEGNMSANSYKRLRRVISKNHSDVLPAYKDVKDAKLEIMPYINEEHDISLQFIRCKVQPLVDVTATSLVKTIYINPSVYLDATMQWKWGLDCSGGHSMYRQANFGRDYHILSTQLVPLIVHLNNPEKTEIWRNPTPNSSQWCRPLSIEFIKDRYLRCYSK